MKVLIFGSTGMVGNALLQQCVIDERIEKIVLVNRSKIDFKNKKVEEILHSNFNDFSTLEGKFQEIESCFFCLGTTAVGKTKLQYEEITINITQAAAVAVYKANPNSNFFYISGTGTDASEKSKVHWARTKGKAENIVKTMGFRRGYAFCPGYIQPMKGVKSKTAWYNAIYKFSGFLYPLLKFLPQYFTDSETLSKAMIEACFLNEKVATFESMDINRLGKHVSTK